MTATVLSPKARFNPTLAVFCLTNGAFFFNVALTLLFQNHWNPWMAGPLIFFQCLMVSLE